MRYVNKLHFQNSAKILPETFSCIVDCFLEIWIRNVCAERTYSMIVDLCYYCMSRII